MRYSVVIDVVGCAVAADPQKMAALVNIPKRERGAWVFIVSSY